MKRKGISTKKITPVAKRTSSKRTSSKSLGNAVGPVIQYQRIIIFSAIVLAIGAFVIVSNKPAVTQSVAGVSVARGLFAEATLALPEIDGAVSYNIYYKQKDDKEYTNAVRDIPLTAAIYTISYLVKGAEYEYKVSAVDETGKEFWWSPIYPLSNVKPM